MPLMVVVDAERKITKFITQSSSVEAVLKAAKVKLGIDSAEQCKLILDGSHANAGLEIDEDEILEELVNDYQQFGAEQKLQLAVIKNTQTWRKEGAIAAQQQAPVVLCEDNASGTVELPAEALSAVGMNSDALPQILNVQVIESPSSSGSHLRALPMSDICPILDAALEDLASLPRGGRRTSVQDKAAFAAAKAIGRFVHRAVHNYSLSTARYYGSSVMEYGEGKYKDVFKQYVGDTLADSGFTWFVSKIYNQFNSIKGSENKQPRAKKPRAEEAAPQDTPKKTRRRKARGDYGCPNFNPPLPEGETAESQDQKRLEAYNLYEVEDYGDSLEELLEVTCASQREEIVACNPMGLLISKFIPRWPQMLRAKFHLLHASRCMKLPQIQVWNSTLAARNTDIIGFMRGFWSSEKEVGKGARGSIFS